MHQFLASVPCPCHQSWERISVQLLFPTLMVKSGGVLDSIAVNPARHPSTAISRTLLSGLSTTLLPDLVYGLTSLIVSRKMGMTECQAGPMPMEFVRLSVAQGVH